MYFYRIEELLVPCEAEDIVSCGGPYVAVLKPKDFMDHHEKFQMGIDMDLDLSHVHDTKAVVNYDSLTGTLNIPDHVSFHKEKFKLAFALDEKGIVFIDEDDYTYHVLENIRATRKWKLPSLERFLYDFLEETIKDDNAMLESVDKNLDSIEASIMKGEIEEYPMQLNDIRSELLDMNRHYEHLIDLAKELEENENGFFQEANLRYFRLLAERVQRLQDHVTTLREYIVQLRDLVSEQLSIRQNKIMTLLTVITSIFMPLTLIAGWFGMNFINMPSTNSKIGYPITIGVSALIIVIELVWFHKKKWL
jgi:magnesium transporter